MLVDVLGHTSRNQWAPVILAELPLSNKSPKLLCHIQLHPSPPEHIEPATDRGGIFIRRCHRSGAIDKPTIRRLNRNNPINPSPSFSNKLARIDKTTNTLSLAARLLGEIGIPYTETASAITIEPGDIIRGLSVLTTCHKAMIRSGQSDSVMPCLSTLIGHVVNQITSVPRHNARKATMPPFRPSRSHTNSKVPAGAYARYKAPTPASRIHQTPFCVNPQMSPEGCRRAGTHAPI